MAMTIEELGKLMNEIDASSNTASNPGINMVQASPTTGTQQFMNTPGYNLAYGNNTSMDPGQRFFNDPGTKLTYGDNNAADPLQRFWQDSATKLAYGDNNSADPSTRFQNDAGTQLAIKAGMQPLLDQFASQGLAQSGALAKALSDYQYHNYDQFIAGQEGMYQNFSNTQANRYNQFNTAQNNLFTQYQNQLQGLTNFGAANSGSSNAMASGSTLAQLLAAANLSTGQNISNANINAGNNISSLFANQGTNGMSGMLNIAGLQNTNVQNYLGQMQQLISNLNSGGATGAASQAGLAGSGGGLF